MKSLMASMVKQSLRRFGIDIHYIDRDDPDFYTDTLRGAISVKKPLNIVQIGANDGKYGDPIYDFVREYEDSIDIILVEPQEKLIPHLKDNYRYHSSAEIVDKAVSTGGEESVELYRIKKRYWSEISTSYGDSWPDYRVPTGVTTSDKTELLQWVSKNIESESKPEDIIEAFEIETSSPKDILKSSDIISEVDLLQVDTESIDDKIVYSFFESDIYPGIINIEDKHLSEAERDDYMNRLENNSYEIYNYINDEILALR